MVAARHLGAQTIADRLPRREPIASRRRSFFASVASLLIGIFPRPKAAQGPSIASWDKLFEGRPKSATAALRLQEGFATRPRLGHQHGRNRPAFFQHCVAT